jgi:hypothetical protein
VLRESGTYAAEWFSIQDRQTLRGAATTVERSKGISFSPSSAASGPAVLYLNTLGR